MDILEQIVLQKKKEVAERKISKPLTELTARPYFKEPCYSLKKSLKSAGSSGIIAEFKRKSPSLGWIKEGADVETITAGYARAGAAGLSVLTDAAFFGGSNEDVRQARKTNSLPILRKDFIIEEYQIFEAKAIGADVILLIAECLTAKEISQFAKTAKALGLEVLMELHSADQIEKLTDDVDFAGVNNRNLKTFGVSIQTSIDLGALIPARFLKIAESGISNASAILTLQQYGFQGFLIGETFMKTHDPEAALLEFVQIINAARKPAIS